MNNEQIKDEKLENHFILRLPVKQANKIRNYLQTKPKKVKKNLKIYLDPDTREGEVIIKNKIIPMKLVDLPTIIESLKTTNSKTFFKTADICQMLMPDLKQNEEDSYISSTRYKNDERKFLWPHGLTPPLKNIRYCRFRKILKNPHRMDTVEISKELKWLLQMDNEAIDVRWELVEDPNYKVKSEDMTQSNNMNEELLFGEIISDSDDEDSIIMNINTSQETKSDASNDSY